MSIKQWCETDEHTRNHVQMRLSDPHLSRWLLRTEISADQELWQNAAAALEAIPQIRAILLKMHPHEAVEHLVSKKDWDRLEELTGLSYEEWKEANL